VKAKSFCNIWIAGLHLFGPIHIHISYWLWQTY